MKLLLSFTLLLVWALSAKAQVISADQVPQAVKDAFARDFPGVTPMKWELHGKGNMAKAWGGRAAQAADKAQAAGKAVAKYVAVWDQAPQGTPAPQGNGKGKGKARNLRSRARYLESGELIFHQVHHPGPMVPTAVSGATMSANPGYKLDWATELKNVKKNQHVFVLRCSKASPKEVRKFFVNPDGSTVSEATLPPDAKEVGDDKE